MQSTEQTAKVEGLNNFNVCRMNLLRGVCLHVDVHVVVVVVGGVEDLVVDRVRVLLLRLLLQLPLLVPPHLLVTRHQDVLWGEPDNMISS